MREKIMLACIDAFNKQGCKFKLDDIAQALQISKKTIYRYFKSKEDILETILTESFDDVHVKQRAIYQNADLGTKEKLLRILTAESKYERRIMVERVAELQQVYPRLYAILLEKYETEWDFVVALLDSGMDAGIFRPVNPLLVQRLLQEGMQTLHRHSFLQSSGMSYWEAIHQMVTIILDGISVN